LNPKALKIIFAGTPEFAAIALQALLDSPHEIIAVYTQPDRPAGRGRKLTASPVKELALKNNLPVHQPLTLRDENEQEILDNLKADVMVVAAYGLLLPRIVLDAPRYGCINIHASLLPRWRGAAPIQRAILAGDTETGVTIMQMEEGLDTGPMLLKISCPINANTTSETLHDRLAIIGATAIKAALADVNALKPETQNNSAASYAHKIKKEEAQINWQLPAEELARMIRAFNPWPVAFTKDNLRIWQASASHENTSAKPGEIINASAESINVATGKGILRLEKLQFPGGKIITANDIWNSSRKDFTIGQTLG
jgi:methionyl-tRNA formyltransferase